jgi:hypothetical protein
MNDDRFAEINEKLEACGWEYNPVTSEFVGVDYETSGRILDHDEMVAATGIPFAELDTFTIRKRSEWRANMSIYESLSQISFPNEFIVEYHNGKRELLLRPGLLSPPGDDPEGIGTLGGGLPKKHSRNQKQCGRAIRFSELKAIHSTDGRQLWPPETT